MLKLSENEKLVFLGALCLSIARAGENPHMGSHIRLAKKLFRDICIKGESYGKTKGTTT